MWTPPPQFQVRENVKAKTPEWRRIADRRLRFPEDCRGKGGMIQYRDIDIQDVSLRTIGDTAIVLNKIKLVAAVGGNEVTVTEVYVQEGGTRKLATLAFTRLLTPDAPPAH